jgi:hypothetical protein
VNAGQTLVPLKMRRFMEFAASRLRKSLAADLAKLDTPASASGERK